MKEIKQFQTESKELLSLMINSIYSNKEIFLREIISNASDAIDKYKYLSISSEGKYPTSEGEIFITIDKKKRYIEILDNGIGMSKTDLEKNLGTIAKSGSKEFLEKLKKSKKGEEINIIGQFGVGFYSAFMVAKSIEVRTKHFDHPGYLFSSDGVKEYSIEENADIKEHGTSVRIYLKKNKDEENYDEYLESSTIERLIKKYSDYIRYPIKMEVTASKPKLDKDGKPIEGQYEDVKEIKTLNSMIPLWKKNKADVSEDELNEFYMSKFGDYEKPFTSLFVSVDGLISYNALLFIPAHAPYNLYSENYEKGLDLYAKGIFIKEKCKELIPDYLKFVKGLVDSNDFPLNISREMLQTSPLLNKMSDNIENKIIAKLKDIKKDDYDKYLEFFKIYGDHLKYGIYSTYGFKKDLLQDLLVFHSLNEDKLVSLSEYKEKMQKGQKYIYYASGRTLESIKMLPTLEKYKKDSVDVLLFDSRIDEFCIMMMREYDKVEFKSISEESSETVDDKLKEEIDTLSAEHKRLLDVIKEALKDEVSDVILSTKLVDSPVCISTKEGLSLNMENVMNEDPSNNGENVKADKILEINPHHDIFLALSKLEGDDEEVKKYASILYDEAIMLEGFEIKDRASFIKKLNELMIKALNK